jgi:hypothetical protein
MKIIHTFASHDIIWKERFYIQMLSALYAKKHYGNIHLYTTEKELKQIENIGLEYTSVNTELLNNLDTKTYSLPKLYVYKEQIEPFLHIDTDSVFYYKFDFSKYKSPFIFSHPDMKHFGKIKGTLGEHIPLLINNMDSNLTNGDYHHINHTYLQLYLKFFNQHSEDIKRNFDFQHIPNMNIVYVNDVETFKSAVNDSINHYQENKQEIDSHNMGPHYIEQLMIHQHLLTKSKEYKESVKNNNTFVFKDVPLYITFDVAKTSSAKIVDTQFPFKFRTTSKCLCCDEQKFNKHKIESIEDIKNFLGFKFFGYTHFSFMQWYQLWQVLVIDELVNEFGQDVVLKAHNYFKRIYPSLDLPILSESEELYEKFTGNFIFSQKKVLY